jgi:hypothetical protein
VKSVAGATRHSLEIVIPRLNFVVGADVLPFCPRRALLGGSDRVDVDHRQLVGRGLDDIAVVVGLDELAPVGGRSSGVG